MVIQYLSHQFLMAIMKNILSKFCKFELIKQYLPKFHKNKKSNIIQGAKSIIFGLNRKLTLYKISKITNIENICNSLEEMSKKVDAVILARDDIENHLEMAEIFLKKRYQYLLIN